MVHELAADSWGYDGRTQEARRLAPAAAPATLRALAGSGSAQRPPVAGTALLLIDFQREYLDGKLPLCGLREAVRKAAQLAAAADAAGVPVIHVHHESASPAASVFAAGGPGVQPIADLPVAAHHQRIVKRLPSSFHGTPLASLLERLRVQTLVLAGCMTHNCVDSTAREALHRNYAVRIAADACATRDLPGIDGSILPAQQVHVASLSALADRHAEVLATSSLVDSWMQSVAAGACGRADVV
jgi:nicotinamidase-related amidase